MKAIETITTGLNKVAAFGNETCHNVSGTTLRIARQKKDFQTQQNFLESNRITKKIKSIFEGVEFVGNTIIIDNKTLLVRPNLRGTGRYLTNGLIYIHTLSGDLVAQLSIEK
jgi:translation initiation factor 6 (eIF-6)